MEICKAETMAKDLIKVHCPEYKFEWSKSKRRLGSCSYHKKTIRLSVYYTLINDESIMKDVVLHEIAHALSPSDAGHGPVWKDMCTVVGAKPERCAPSIINRPIGKYKYQCINCNKMIVRIRKINKSGLACSDCCNKYNNGKYHESFKFVEALR